MGCSASHVSSVTEAKDASHSRDNGNRGTTVTVSPRTANGINGSNVNGRIEESNGSSHGNQKDRDAGSSLQVHNNNSVGAPYRTDGLTTSAQRSRSPVCVCVMLLLYHTPCSHYLYTKIE
jgi:hypothetical protein